MYPTVRCMPRICAEGERVPNVRYNFQKVSRMTGQILNPPYKEI